MKHSRNPIEIEYPECRNFFGCSSHFLLPALWSTFHFIIASTVLLDKKGGWWLVILVVNLVSSSRFNRKTFSVFLFKRYLNIGKNIVFSILGYRNRSKSFLSMNLFFCQIHLLLRSLYKSRIFRNIYKIEMAHKCFINYFFISYRIIKIWKIEFVCISFYNYSII